MRQRLGQFELEGRELLVVRVGEPDRRRVLDELLWFDQGAVQVREVGIGVFGIVCGGVTVEAVGPAGIAGGHHLAVVASVCGTDEDPQDRQSQIQKLEGADVIVALSSAQAAEFAGSLVAELNE